MSAHPQQLLIGLDAMEWSLVKRWAAEGKLPTFRRLMECGVRGQLSSTAESLADTVWPALCCGVNPGKLKKYFYVQYDPDTASLRYMGDSEIPVRPFWHYLDERGLQVVIVDVPKLPLQELVHGFGVVSWGTHENIHSPRTSPCSLLAQIESTVGKHPVEDCEKYGHNLQARQKLREAILDGIYTHGKLFRWLMKTHSWNVFFAVFSAPHCVGHHFWGFMDPVGLGYQEGDPHHLADTIELAYRAIDSEIGKMMAMAGEHTRVLAFAAHGMGPLYHASWNLTEILDLLGFNGQGRTSSEQRFGKVNPWRILKMIVPSKLQYRIKDSLPKRWQDHLLFLWYAGRRSYAGRRVFAVPNNDNAGAIRISVVGRDHKGLVHPGEEYRQLSDEITKAMYELTDPVTGRAIVQEVFQVQEKYHGPSVKELPDLAIRWDHSYPWHAVHSPRFGTLRLRRQDSRSGAHSAYGFVIATGPGLPAGIELDGYSIYDIAPTVLHVAGVPIPEVMDGQPRLALMTNDEVRMAPISHHPS